MKSVDALMKDAIQNGVFPGGVLLVSRRRDILFHEAYGTADPFTRRNVSKNTVFDLASLTKPLATTLAVMKLEEQHKVELDQPLGAILDSFIGSDKAGITIQHLLKHTSGLPDYKPYFEELKSIPWQERKSKLREYLIKEKLVSPIGAQTLYSDIGFMILNWIIEEAACKRLDQFVKDEIYEPAGLKRLFFVDLSSSDQGQGAADLEFAATEDCPWRKRVICGEVHDDNAFVVGGIDGHAGLFGTAAEVNRLLVLLQELYHGHLEKSVLKSKTIQKYLSQPEPDMRVLGLDTPSSENSSCGKYFSKRTVGHLGFTGTSFWMDLEKEVNVILLTNRIHPSRKNVRIRAFRPRIHDMVMKNI